MSGVHPGVVTMANTTDRGYGWAHQQARLDALRDMVDGQRCPRCSRPMWRSQARHLDLGHTEDRSAYQGLEHRSCNRRAGQAKAMRARRTPNLTASPTPRSRNW